MINARLNQSAQRAKKVLLEKANSGILLSNRLKKARDYRQEINHKKEEEAVQRILKIQQDIEFSQVKSM